MHTELSASAVRGPDHPGFLPGPLLAGLVAPGAEMTDPVRRSARDVVADVLSIAVAILISMAIFAIGPSALGFPGNSGLINGIGAGAWLLLWWRRRWPIPVAVFLLVEAVFIPVAAGAALIAVFTVSVHERLGAAAALTGSAAAIALVQHRLHPLDPDTPATYWTTVGVHVLLIATAATWGVTVRARRQLVLSLAERTRRAETEQRLRLEHARRLERERIAREMHDVLAHRLSLLSMHAGALEYRPDATRETIAETAGVIRASAHQSLLDLREIISVLREPGDNPDGGDESLHPQPALSELAALVAENRDAGCSVTVHDEDLATVDAAAPLGRTAYRIVQEGLTNARKHAPGRPIDLELAGGPGDGLRITLHNDLPRSAEPTVPGSGTGLVGLAERAELAGGRIEYGITASGRFGLAAWLPWTR